ncbi:MAG: ATP-binding protein [Dysgonamonadaceae bacterium]|jgi:AAA+ ATPase superfamily predicted ATPase|nr:ATP-binding protein [Dysgonamonadaceae bacterium]
MAQKLVNPFLIAGYNSPTYFCDRERETAKVIEALANSRNVTLISPRRIGKTGLIHHVFYNLKEQNRDIRCFYFDIFSTQNLYDFVTLFGKTVIGKLDDFSEKMMKNLSALFKSIRPSLSFDSVTGEPSLSLDIQAQAAEQSLQEIFDYLKSSNRRIYIAIDEFQQISEYTEKGVEALLRSYIQFLPNVNFIFAGSKKHLMDEMFSSAGRPFYQSTQKIGLKELPIETYRNFAVKMFSDYGKTIDNKLFDYIYNKLFGHTWYIQLILNHLFAKNIELPTEQSVNSIIEDILEEENATYKTYCEMLAKGQLRLLRAIAMEGKVLEPTEQAFMKKHNLTAPSSVRQALKALIDKMLIIKDENDAYYVYDRFFSLWLDKS